MKSLSSSTSCCVSVLSRIDRKSTRLNSSHLGTSYAVFCLKKKKKLMNIAASQTDGTSGADKNHNQHSAISNNVRPTIIVPKSAHSPSPTLACTTNQCNLF